MNAKCENQMQKSQEMKSQNISHVCKNHSTFCQSVLICSEQKDGKMTRVWAEKSHEAMT